MNEQLGRDYLHQQGLTTRLADRRIMPIQTDTRLLFHPTGAYGEFLITGAFLIVFQQLILISLSFSMGLRKELTPISPRLRFPFARLAGRVAAGRKPTDDTQPTVGCVDPGGGVGKAGSGHGARRFPLAGAGREAVGVVYDGAVGAERRDGG